MVSKQNIFPILWNDCWRIGIAPNDLDFIPVTEKTFYLGLIVYRLFRFFVFVTCLSTVTILAKATITFLLHQRLYRVWKMLQWICFGVALIACQRNMATDPFWHLYHTLCFWEMKRTRFELKNGKHRAMYKKHECKQAINKINTYPLYQSYTATII